MTTRIKLRRDTAANWLDANPVLAAGEPGLETDTGKIKYGDGETAYADLPHAGGDTLNDEGGVVVTAGSTKNWMALQRRENNNTVGRGVRHDSQGNVYALTRSYDGTNDFAVITKYSSVGGVVWQHTIDYFNPYSLAVDSADCAYIAGENEDDGSIIEVWKFDTSGSTLWKKSYDGGNWTGECFIEERTGTRLALVANRDNGDYGVLVLDINSSTGAVVTQKLINLDGPLDVFCSGIDTDEDGNVIVTGRYYDSGSDRYKMFIEKLNSSLDRVWSKSLDTETTYQMTAGDCASDSQGNIYAVAYYNVDRNNADDGNGLGTVGILIKLNSAGVTQWTRRLGPGPCGDGIVGLTATPVGDLYLSTITVTPSTNPRLDDGQKFAEGDIRMIVAKYDTAGDVIWQRYIDDDLVWEVNDNFRGQAISVYDDKFVTDYYGDSTNVRQINYSSVNDNETECYIVQLPTDGTDLEIGTMAFKASRIPGRFITQAVTTSPLFLDIFGGTVTVADSGLTIDSQDRIANSLIRSESYDYVFGADGTLTIPNDGDVKLTQSQVGFLATIGGMNNNYGSIQNHAVVVDSDGFMYAGGEEYNNYNGYVSKISPEGQREWSVRIYELNDNWNLGVKSLAIHPTTGNLLAVCDVWANPNRYGAVVTIDPDTGRILANAEYKDDNTDIAISELTFLSTGDWVAVGGKNGEFSAEQTVTPLEGSTTQRLILARSAVDGQMDASWQIGGTGFSAFEQIAAIEQWSNLTSTTDAASGNGAQITVDIIGGNYQIGTIPTPGTGYQVGRFLKVLGTNLGGTTPTNDLIVKVTGIDGSGGVASIDLISGTAVTGLPTYTYASKFAAVSNDRTFYIKPDGTRMYTLVTGTLTEYTLSTPWDISTATSTSSVDLNTALSIDLLNGVYFKPDGTELYVFAYDTNSDVRFSKITLATPWNIGSTPTYVQGNTIAVPFAISLEFKDDGTKFYSIYNNQIRQWNLGSAWDISGVDATPDVSYDFNTIDTIDIRDIAFSADGTSMYATKMPSSGSTWTVVRYQLGTAWDISTATLTADSIDISEGVTGFNYIDRANIAFKPDRTSMYIAGFTSSGARVVQFDGASSDSNYPSVATATILGSGFTFGSFWGPVISNNYADRQTFSGGPPGEKYAINDVIRFAGTQLGGTTPANDMLVTVTNVDYYGSVTDFTISGTAQSTTWNITTTTNVDFSQSGSWQLTRPLSRECLLLTQNWQRTYGTNTGDYTDEINAVAVDSGNNIITVGMGYGIVTAQDRRDLAVVYKFNSSGTLQWARKLNFNTNSCSAKSVTTVGTDIYVTHNEDGNNTVITKLSADGTVQWQKTTDSNGDNDSVVVPAGDGNILVMTPAYQSDIDDDMMKIFKITPSGETVYKRWFSAVTDNDTRLNQGRSMAVRNGSMYIAGRYDTNNYNSTWAARLPADGTGTGDYGQFRYSGTNQESGSYSYWGLTNIEYSINEITNSYAGTLTVEPYVNTTDMGLATEGDYGINSFYENYYVEPVRDIGGGRIIFPDGTTQDTSAIDVPQRIHRGERYTLSLRDRGHHIYCEEQNDNIIIPYYARVPFPVGSQIMFVNDSGNTVYVNTEGSNISVILSGDGGTYNYFSIQNGDVATLLNVGRDRWFFYGDVNWD